MVKMPGKSYQGEMGPLSEEESAIRDELKRDVEKLAGDIGERNVSFRYKELVAAVDFIEKSLTEAGYEVKRQDYNVDNKVCTNIEVEIKGTEKPGEIVIVGAHYDSVYGSNGANDNASGVAGTLALARRFADKKIERTLRFVLFVNEEPPFFHTSRMGSWVYAKRCRQRQENVVAMLSLETIGYFTDEPNSQKYPFPLGLVYPSTGNFIGFVSNMGRSAKLVRKVIALFREKCKFPSQGGTIPGFIPGIGWSDHWAFWQEGYPGLMVTDTAPFRYPYYHEVDDTPDKLDYERMARVVKGVEEVVAELVSGVEL